MLRAGILKNLGGQNKKLPARYLAQNIDGHNCLHPSPRPPQCCQSKNGLKPVQAVLRLPGLGYFPSGCYLGLLQ